MGAIYGPTSSWTIPREETTIFFDQEGEGHETTEGFEGTYTLPPNSEEYYKYDEIQQEHECLTSSINYAHFYTADTHSADIHHRPWPLCEAEAEVEHDSMAAPFDIATSDHPVLHFARRLEVVIWPLRPAGPVRAA